MKTSKTFSAVTSVPVYIFFSTKGERKYWDCDFEPGSFLVFGNEGSGFPEDFYEKYMDKTYVIPMPGKHARSMNLANAVAVALYEGMRKSSLMR